MDTKNTIDLTDDEMELTELNYRDAYFAAFHHLVTTHDQVIELQNQLHHLQVEMAKLRTYLIRAQREVEAAAVGEDEEENEEEK